MEIPIYAGKKINSVRQTYEKEIKDTFTPNIQKNYKNKIKGELKWKLLYTKVKR